MKSYHLFGLICVTLVTFASATFAHPGHDHDSEPNGPALRRWIDLSTGETWMASLVSSQGGQVQLRLVDGKLLRFPIDRLTKVDRAWIERRIDEIRAANETRLTLAEVDETPSDTDCQTPANNNNDPASALARAFEPFANLKAVTYRSDRNYFYVESNGIPEHPMMVGITAWQQQVPLPQKYTGNNAWQIPLNPVPAKQPATTKNRFLRGAIALAVNGIPIFNPLNNRGDDAYLFGELDEYGGHCGRADDYHYHLAPVHLEKQTGKGKPIAYALDGYPIYGYEEPDGSPVVGLDGLNGHKDADGNYHYHATKQYPYLNGGFYGEVVEHDGQVDPQPRAEPLRPALPPLRGAKIVGFASTQPNSHLLTYELSGRQGTVAYTMNDNGSVSFTFTDPKGMRTNETYQPRQRPGEPARESRPPRKEDRLPPRADNSQAAIPIVRANDKAQLVVTSPAFETNGKLPAEFTCDGQGVSPPVQWSGAPQGMKYFALTLWHTAPDREKSYWVVYNIPADTTRLEKNSKSVGLTGLNDMRRAAYEPMCSKGPGVKTYHITVYALSSELQLPPDQASRANLLTAMKAVTLAEGTLSFQYERRRQN